MLEELVRDGDDHRAIHGVCVDDDGPFVELVEQMLTTVSDRLTVDTYTDPSGALSAVREDDGIEFVVSDYEMPRMNGLELLRELRADRPRLPFVLFTGKGSEEIASEAISAGVSDYVQKRSGREPYELLANRVIDHVEKVREREALERSREQFRRLVEQSVAGIALTQDGRFVYVNGRYAEMFGYEPAELQGTRALELVDERDHERVREHMRRREAGEVESIHYVARGVTKDGESVPVELHGSRVTFDGDPAVLGVVVRLDDVEATSRLLELARADLASAAADREDDRLERTLDLLDRAIADDG